MRVYLPRTGAGHWSDFSVGDLELRARSDRFRVHELTTNPEEADIILFTQCHMVDWRLRAVREHPVARDYWDKVMVYDERDRPWRSFPGVYVSAPSRAFDSATQRTWGYAWTEDVPIAEPEPELLFSFVGSPTAPCREPLFRLRHPDAVIEEVEGFMFWNPELPGHAAQHERFREVLGRSRFVLCPRGRGTSTMRLYETLGAGRVPVIISDDWVPPSGPDWDSCSLRWPEGRTDGLVEFLAERDRDWSAMGAAAADVYETYFASDAVFHRIVELCRELREAGARPESARRLRNRSIRAALGARFDARRPNAA